MYQLNILKGSLILVDQTNCFLCFSLLSLLNKCKSKIKKEEFHKHLFIHLQCVFDDYSQKKLKFFKRLTFRVSSDCYFYSMRDCSKVMSDPAVLKIVLKAGKLA